MREMPSQPVRPITMITVFTPLPMIDAIATASTM